MTSNKSPNQKLNAQSPQGTYSNAPIDSTSLYTKKHHDKCDTQQPAMHSNDHSSVRVLLAYPRGFCAGVQRAVNMVEIAISKYGAPIYIKHQIVHNEHVIDRLIRLGAVFVKSIQDVPPGSKIIFSAHGVPPSDMKYAKDRGLDILDATCPLVHKIHQEVRHYHQKGYHTLLIGHRRHPEIIGILGEVPSHAVTLVEDLQSAIDLPANLGSSKCSYATQTTLSIWDTQKIIDVLKAKFPDIQCPKTADICYATYNRQQAAFLIGQQADIGLVIGGKLSSNSARLAEVMRQAGCPLTYHIQGPEDIPIQQIKQGTCLGLTSGASTPEILIDMTLQTLRDHFNVCITSLNIVAQEDVFFQLPASLRHSKDDEKA